MKQHVSFDILIASVLIHSFHLRLQFIAVNYKNIQTLINCRNSHVLRYKL